MEGKKKKQVGFVDTEALIARAQAGDGVAWALIYKRFRERVYRFLLAATGSHVNAEDLTQQTFMRAHKYIGGYERRPDTSFFDWLRAVADNLAKSAFRKQDPSWLVSPIDLHDLKEQIDDRSGLLAENETEIGWIKDPELLEDLRALSESQRLMVCLKYFFGLSAQGIAEIVGGSPDGVRQHQSRALAALRDKDAKRRQPNLSGPHHRRESAMVRMPRSSLVLLSRRFVLTPSPPMF
ncbi:MAG: hypothetical protein QOJ38_1737 [Solirubrobacterales bacterium]|jgi:RNA polymerase sigma-70 factor (ECF subfamily)|nr:hypothetical protein [Solirubrobacterales bacterium]